MLRREFIAGVAAAPLALGKNDFGRDRLAGISDEMGRTPAEAIEFAHKFGLKFLEIRGIPGAKKHYYKATDEELRAAAKEFRDGGIRISYFNTPFFKSTLPGTEPVFNKPETPEARQRRIERDKILFDTRKAEIEQAIRAAHILDVDKIRVFGFLRTAEPAKAMQRVAEVLGETAEMCHKEGIKILVENEVPCNAATSTELAMLMKLLPEKSVGLNWDPLNAVHRGETVYPDGYQALPKKRIGNVQVKGRSLLDEKEKLDWASIFSALRKDGYKGKIGLETHYFDGTMFEKSHICMEQLVRMMDSTVS